MRKVKTIITTLLLILLVISETTSVLPANVSIKAMPLSEESNRILGQDISIKGNNSVGRMVANALVSKQKEQNENSGCNIFSAVVTGKYVTVSFETITDGTLVAGIYDESGIKMLATGTTMVTAGMVETEIAIETDRMPTYFYLRVFLVDNDTLQPLASSYESPNYTQEMQEFLSKTTEDFDKERVLNLDSDKNTNFAVYNKKTKIINQRNKTNRLVSSDEQTKKYTFENPDENITSLSIGDIAAFNFGDHNVLIVKVADIQEDGTAVTIKGEDSSLEDAFDYVKIEGNANNAQAVVDDSTCKDGVVYNGLAEEKENKTNLKIQSVSSQDKKITEESDSLEATDINASQSETLSFSFIDKKIVGNDTNNVKVSGKAELKNEVSLKLYISLSYQYLELKSGYSLKVDISVSGNGKGEIPLATLGFSPMLGVIIEITPSFVVEADAKVEVSGTLKGTVGFAVSNDEGMKNLTSAPKFESSIDIEGTVFIGLSLKPRIAIISDNIIKVEVEAKVGGEIKAAMALWETDSSSNIHTCKNCIDGDVSAKLSLEFETKFLNSDKLKYKFEMLNYSVKIADFYYSFDHEEGGWTVCPYLKYKVDVMVKDENGNLLEDAKVKAAFTIMGENGELMEQSVITTNKEGKAVGYLSNGEYTLKISKDGYQDVDKKIVVLDKSKDIIVELESDFGGESGNIYDRAKILTKSEIQKLNKEIVDASKEVAIDFYIVTTNDLQEKSITRYMEDFADEHNFTNVAILCISFQPPRGFEIQGYGSAMYCLTYEKINLIFDDMQDDLTNGNYYKACSTFVQEAKQYQLIGGNTISQKSKFERIYLSKIGLDMLYNDKNLNQTTQIKKTTTTFSNLHPNRTYTFYAVKSKTEENLLTAQNLLYINQAVSDGKGNISFTYELKENYNSPKLFLGGEKEDSQPGTIIPTEQPTVTVTPLPEVTSKPIVETTVPTTSTVPKQTDAPKVVKKGIVLTVAKKNCKVKVNSSSAKNPTVIYQKTTKMKAATVTVPETVQIKDVTYKVTAIANNAFSGNKKLTKITIGKNVTSIGENAFKNCTKLKNITLKSCKVKVVGKNALKGTNKKMTIKVPAKKVSIYKKLFKRKGNTKIILKKL